MDKVKKPRSANFIPAEVEILCDLVEKYKLTIENKKTDAVTWKGKERAWIQVAAEFNARGVGVYRDAKTLKLKYESIKKNTRKKSAIIRTEVYRTGGVPTTAPPLTPAEEKVKKIILLSVDGLPSTFDSDDPLFISRSKLDEIEEGRLEVIHLQKKIALHDLRMKEEEEKQTVLRWEFEARQRTREEKIKEIKLEIKELILKKINDTG